MFLCRIFVLSFSTVVFGDTFFPRPGPFLKESSMLEEHSPDQVTWKLYYDRPSNEQGFANSQKLSKDVDDGGSQKVTPSASDSGFSNALGFGFPPSGSVNIDDHQGPEESAIGPTSPEFVGNSQELSNDIDDGGSQKVTPSASDNGFSNALGIGFPPSESANSDNPRPGESTNEPSTPVFVENNFVPGHFVFHQITEHDIPEASCIRRCPSVSNREPVCGTDNVTYTNKGKLRCAQRCGRPVEFSYYGVCEVTIGI